MTFERLKRMTRRDLVQWAPESLCRVCGHEIPWDRPDRICECCREDEELEAMLWEDN